MRWVIPAAVALVLATASAAGARPAANGSDVLQALDRVRHAIALEREAIGALTVPRRPPVALERIGASLDELSRAQDLVPYVPEYHALRADLLEAVVDDRDAQALARRGDFAAALRMLRRAIARKEAVLSDYEQARRGCHVAIGESRASPGESEIAVSGCPQAVESLVFTLPRRVTSMSKVAVVSAKIGGGLAVSSCVQPAPDEVLCGGYPTFMPPGATAVIDILPHARKGDSGKVEARLASGATITLSFTQR